MGRIIAAAVGAFLLFGLFADWMPILLLIGGSIVGFLFPIFLIRAIRNQDEETETTKNTALASLTFGLCIAAILLMIFCNSPEF